MTIEELQRETLMEKNRRLLQEKCRHSEIYCSVACGPNGTFETRVCLDCLKSWRR
jgi:hypothetical protein